MSWKALYNTDRDDKAFDETVATWPTESKAMICRSDSCSCSGECIYLLGAKEIIC